MGLFMRTKDQKYRCQVEIICYQKINKIILRQKFSNSFVLHENTNRMNRIRRVIIGDKYLTLFQYTCHRKERK